MEKNNSEIADENQIGKKEPKSSKGLAEKNNKNLFKMLRMARGYSVHGIAEALGVTPTYIHAIEAGTRTPSDELFAKYLEVLNVDEKLFTTFSAKANAKTTYEKLLLFLLKLIVNFDKEKARKITKTI